MLIIVNPGAGGGASRARWKRVESVIRADIASDASVRTVDRPCSVQCLGDPAGLHEAVQTALAAGETDFVAAGGDGTVNRLLNVLIGAATPAQRAALRLGAIGLGSSNDFHKPLQGSRYRCGVPVRLDLARAALRDVGMLEYSDGEHPARRHYFLVNASIGVTAEANAFFNHPDACLRGLKRMHTPTAIAYAALRTLLRYQGLRLTVQSAGSGCRDVDLSNLAILKSPHFAGSLRFAEPAQYANGQFSVHLFTKLSRIGLVAALYRLSRGQAGTSTDHAWSSASVAVSSERPFAVEIDGEVVHARVARFAVQACSLRVCP